MFRKIILGLTAAAAIGGAALVPTTASAHPMGGFHFGHFGHFGHWGHWGRFGWYGGYDGDGDCYIVRKWNGRRILVCQ
jgi:hypothetical protein